MSVPILLSARCRSDLYAIIGWGDSIVPGLAESLLVDLGRTFERARRFPAVYPEILGEHRRANLARFPYAMIYHYNDERIVVIALLRVSGTAFPVPLQSEA